MPGQPDASLGGPDRRLQLWAKLGEYAARGDLRMPGSSGEVLYAVLLTGRLDQGGAKELVASWHPGAEIDTAFAESWGIVESYATRASAGGKNLPAVGPVLQRALLELQAMHRHQATLKQGGAAPELIETFLMSIIEGVGPDLRTAEQSKAAVTASMVIAGELPLTKAAPREIPPDAIVLPMSDRIRLAKVVQAYREAAGSEFVGREAKTLEELAKFIDAHSLRNLLQEGFIAPDVVNNIAWTEWRRAYKAGSLGVAVLDANELGILPSSTQQKLADVCGGQVAPAQLSHDPADHPVLRPAVVPSTLIELPANSSRIAALVYELRAATEDKERFGDSRATTTNLVRHFRVKILTELLLTGRVDPNATALPYRAAGASVEMLQTITDRVEELATKDGVAVRPIDNTTIVWNRKTDEITSGTKDGELAVLVKMWSTASKALAEADRQAPSVSGQADRDTTGLAQTRLCLEYQQTFASQMLIRGRMWPVRTAKAMIEGALATGRLSSRLGDATFTKLQAITSAAVRDVASLGTKDIG